MSVGEILAALRKKKQAAAPIGTVQKGGQGVVYDFSGLAPKPC
jgi:hypothetical protein